LTSATRLIRTDVGAAATSKSDFMNKISLYLGLGMALAAEAHLRQFASEQVHVKADVA
jgi:hypothetical protein